MSEKSVLEMCRENLKIASASNAFTIIYKFPPSDETLLAVKALARHLARDGHKPAFLPIPIEILPDLYIGMAPDKKKDFGEGRPVIVAPTYRAAKDKHKTNRPHDTPFLQNAKTALEVTTFKAEVSQTAVELSKNTTNRQITNVEARLRAEEKLARKAWRCGHDPDDEKKQKYFRGLIDRGRRKVAAFSNQPKPGEVAKLEKIDTKRRLEALGTNGVTMVEADNLMRIHTSAHHVLRTNAHESAMYRWSRNVDKGAPIDAADLMDITNAVSERTPAQQLMRIAIDGDINPADADHNHELTRGAFETGRKIGRLSRGHTVTISLSDAKILYAAIQTVRRGRPQTDADGSDYFLAHAIGQCWHPDKVQGIIMRVLQSGQSELVPPGSDKMT